MKMILKILAVLMVTMFYTRVNAQDMTLNQTLEYINKKINENKAINDKNMMYVWEVDNAGRLIITQYINDEWFFSQTVYLKSLDKCNIVINDENSDQSEYFFTLNVKCKNNKANVARKHRRTLKTSSVFIRIAPNLEVANQIRNAISTLIYLAESKNEYQVADFDPFDPSLILTSTY